MIKNFGRFILRGLTPLPTLKKQGQDIKGSFDRTAERIKAFRESMARQRAPADQGLAMLTPEERFERRYVEGGWDERRLAIQSGKIRITKFVYLSLAAILPVAAIWQLAVSPAWTVYIVSPALVFGGLVFAWQTIRHAHWDYQIYTRSFVSIREFMGRREFWRFLFT